MASRIKRRNADHARFGKSSLVFNSRDRKTNNRMSASNLWIHCAETHNLHLLESEESDIRHACNLEQEREIISLKNQLALIEREKTLVIETCERHAKLYEVKLEALRAEIKTLCGGQ